MSGTWATVTATPAMSVVAMVESAKPLSVKLTLMVAAERILGARRSPMRMVAYFFI